MKFRLHCLSVFWLLAMYAIGIETSGFAQERQKGGVGITVFADLNFSGKSATFRQDVPDLRAVGFNDTITSLRVAPGERWEVCEHP